MRTYGLDRYASRSIERSVVVKPSSIYYIGSKPFVIAWFQC